MRPQLYLTDNAVETGDAHGAGSLWQRPTVGALIALPAHTKPGLKIEFLIFHVWIKLHIYSIFIVLSFLYIKDITTIVQIYIKMLKMDRKYFITQLIAKKLYVQNKLN